MIRDQDGLLARSRRRERASHLAGAGVDAERREQRAEWIGIRWTRGSDCELRYGFGFGLWLWRPFRQKSRDRCRRLVFRRFGRLAPGRPPCGRSSLALAEARRRGRMAEGASSLSVASVPADGFGFDRSGVISADCVPNGDSYIAAVETFFVRTGRYAPIYDRDTWTERRKALDVLDTAMAMV